METILVPVVNEFKYVDPYPGRDAAELIWEACGRCGGAGHFEMYESLNGGDCFECHGRKGAHSSVKALRSRESGRMSRARAAERKYVASVELHNTNARAALALDPAAEAWGSLISEDSFMMSLWDQSFDRELSEKQLSALVAGILRRVERTAARAAEAEAAAPVPEGRYELEGEVASVKLQEGDYGSTWKMIVKAEAGYKVWLTVPAALLDALDAEAGDTARVDSLKGRRVRMTATVEASRDDKAFGFGKRPSKAALLPAD